MVNSGGGRGLIRNPVSLKVQSPLIYGNIPWDTQGKRLNRYDEYRHQHFPARSSAKIVREVLCTYVKGITMMSIRPNLEAADHAIVRLRLRLNVLKR